MRKQTLDSHEVSSLLLRNVTSYLRAKGWSKDTQWGEHAEIWRHEELDEELLVPASSSLHDYANRIGDIVTALSSAEMRGSAKIISDIQMVQADVVRLRLYEDEGDTEHSLPLESTTSAIQTVKELFTAAALATVHPKPYYASRKPDKVKDYMRGLRLAQTEQGSYVLKVISPLTPRLQQNSLFDEPELELPFERKVTQTLAKSMRSLQEALEKTALTASTEPLNRAVEEGVSANLCDALLRMKGPRGQYSFDISFLWSGQYQAPPHLPSTLRFQRERFDAELLEASSRHLKQQDFTIEDFELEGFVVKCANNPNNESDGTITVMGTVEDRTRQVSLSLEKKDYESAVQAHKEEQPIHLTGELVRVGHNYQLKHPRKLYIITDE